MSLPYTYTANVPQSTQQINNSQQSINYNFQDIATLFAVNHVPFNTSNTFGTHNFVNFVTQTTDPTTGSAEMALYTKAISGDTNNAELFYRYPDSGTVLQLTGSTSSSGSTGSGGGLFSTSLTNDGSLNLVGYPETGAWQYLANGILMMTWWVGNGGPTSGNGSTSPMNVIIPNSTNCATYVGSSTMPTFTTAIYNLQMSGTNPQGETSSSTLGCNNAITIVDTTTATLYWQGTASFGTQGSIVVTAIGY